MHLAESDCKLIMYSVTNAVLSKSVIAFNISASIRDGPIGSGGAELLSLFYYQGTSRTVMVVEQVNRKTPTGMFLLKCIENLAHDAGLYSSIWNMTFNYISKYI